MKKIIFKAVSNHDTFTLERPLETAGVIDVSRGALFNMFTSVYCINEEEANAFAAEFLTCISRQGVELVYDANSELCSYTHRARCNAYGFVNGKGSRAQAGDSLCLVNGVGLFIGMPEKSGVYITVENC